ncbi:hypothetical protein SPRG_01832 [Saprolegnia parasitica CBS 223.65]|uniref:Thioredoxin domain-containing protein n=1 Tax=Saprolegnia parasitica (strain CBS 223.65) TaxID=695850 RepID=A0A067D2M2_SAPPC|nr:hypothetical protein SPRG_01832 [Saprolegnia parasitica CBS 223.65]KDO33016.1 hypothetical protein SPRG_01832 [Saprolegnia parasitica CBS 223.65]|eukprot:XP_012195790.1 hypothetical protein SPRG_01832 [Saprolegnia parasitica CBS 223.65]
MLRLASSSARRLRALSRTFASSRVQVLESETEYASLIAKPEAKSIVYFTAPWSGPCNAIAPIFSELSNAFPSLNFAQLDVHELDDTAVEAGIRDMPTFHFYVNGKLQEPLELAGMDVNQLKDNIQKLADL